MTIRQETPNDFPEIHELVKTAFQTAKVSDGDEQEFVLKLRSGKNYLPDLALVVEEDNKIIGHIMLTRTFVTRVAGDQVEALLLAPVCIQQEYRNRKLGSRLIEHTLNLAKTKGHKAVFLVGDPAYYKRFGFKPTTQFGIRYAGEIPDQYIMGLELEPGALNGVQGTIFIC